jgi:mono/diheme cytochrome c family protein
MRAWSHAGLAVAVLWAATAAAQTPQTKQPPSSDAVNAGATLVATKCFQCHTDTMFRDGRQDRRGWEATVYRMVGRGGLWTTEEINSMADYLSTAYGLDVKPPTASK